MIRDKYRKNWEWGVTAFLVILCCIAAYFFFQRWDDVSAGIHRLMDILEPIAIGFALAFVLDSLVVRLAWLLHRLPVARKRDPHAQWRGYRIIAIVLTELITVALVLLILISVIPQFVKSAAAMIGNMNTYITSIRQLIMPALERYPDIQEAVNNAFDNVSLYVRNYLQNDLITLLPSVTNTALQVGSSVYNVGLGVIVSIYALAAKDRLVGRGKKLLYALVKTNYANRFMAAGRYTVRAFKSFFVGKVVDSFIVGVLCFIGISLLGMPYTLLISIVVGVTNIIPYFGPFLGAVPSALLILAVDPQKCLIFVIFILVLQQLDGNYIGPKVLGNTTGLTSLGVMASILIGGGLFGILGMLVSVPMYAVTYAFVKRFAEKRLLKRGMPEETAAYIRMDRVDEKGTVVPLPEDAPQRQKTAERKARQRK